MESRLVIYGPENGYNFPYSRLLRVKEKKYKTFALEERKRMNLVTVGQAVWQWYWWMIIAEKVTVDCCW